MSIVSVRMGVRTMPIAVPTRLASVTRPTAIARSCTVNQLAGTFVHALSKNGCATRDRRIADPHGLNGQIDEHEDRKDDPAVAIHRVFSLRHSCSLPQSIRIQNQSL